jgi:hypothetical protein
MLVACAKRLLKNMPGSESMVKIYEWGAGIPKNYKESLN